MLKDNIEYASKRLGKQLDITVLQGDSRNLSQLLQENNLAVVMSPPYYQSQKEGQDSTISIHGRNYARNKFGDNPLNIGNCPDHPVAAVFSPPYGDSNIRQGNRAFNLVVAGESMEYSDNPANIGNLTDKPVAAVFSPPYEDTMNSGISGIDWTKCKRENGTPRDFTKEAGFSTRLGGGLEIKYGQTEGQIGKEKQESYLEAMKIIYSEVIKVASSITVVVKNPTRAGKIRELDKDTIALLEATGWKINCIHKAMLFKEEIKQDLFGETTKKPKGRISFFKRLSYQKGSPVADHEVIITATREGEGLASVFSPPFLDSTLSKDKAFIFKYEKEHRNNSRWQGGGNEGYGTNPKQIGNLK